MAAGWVWTALPWLSLYQEVVFYVDAGGEVDGLAAGDGLGSGYLGAGLEVGVGVAPSPGTGGAEKHFHLYDFGLGLGGQG